MKRKTRVPKGIVLMIEEFSKVPDPRVDRTRLHPLVNIIVMSLCGAICGADGWEALEIYAAARHEFFASFLEMPDGTPSADTFRRVLSMLEPKAFERAFRNWVSGFVGSLAGETIAFDGKALRGALARTQQAGPFHMAHLWATSKQVLLGMRAVAGAPGEVEAFLEMIEYLDLRGAIVTADANSCTAAVTLACRQAGADYVLALKGNRDALHSQVKEAFADAEAHQFQGVRQFESHDEGHGRVEDRIIRTLSMKKIPLNSQAPWEDLRTAVQAERTRVVDGVTSTERFYYITSLPPKPEELARHIRGHWSIENQLHHTLDVSFNDDDRAIHDPIGAQNFALIARYALVLIKREASRKMSVAMKRRRAAWQHDYLLQILTAGTIEV